MKHDLYYGYTYYIEYKYSEKHKSIISSIWYNKSKYIESTYIMPIKIGGLDRDFYVFVSKESSDTQIIFNIYYAQYGEITLDPPWFSKMYHIGVQTIKYNISNIELMKLKHYIKSNNCLNHSKPSEGVKYYKHFTPNGIILSEQLKFYDKFIKKIGYFIACSPPVNGLLGKFSGGALYKRKMLHFECLK